MLLASGCSDEYDDSALTGRVGDLENRVKTLEELCRQMNTNISSLQTLVTALQNGDYITSVTPVTSGGQTIGYTSISEEEEMKILEYCKNTNGVKHIKTMRTRKHGAFAYVDLVICVDGNLTVIQGHDIASDLEKKLIDEISLIKGITVHVEPCNNKVDSCDKEISKEPQILKEHICTECNSKDCLNNGK